MIDNFLIALRGCLPSVVLLLASGLTTSALAQQNAPQTAPAAQGPTSPGAPAAEESSAINSGQALYLVRSALLTLNDANRSGNYTVLRDLAAPDFQAKNTAADLAQVFADLRSRNFDLFAAALLAPQFTATPAVDAAGRVRLTGFFATQPLQISFDLTFQSVAGQWRLFAVSVATPGTPKKQSQVSRPPLRGTPGLFYGFRLFSGSAGLRW